MFSTGCGKSLYSLKYSWKYLEFSRVFRLEIRKTVDKSVETVENFIRLRDVENPTGGRVVENR